jgi:hypothetical protein
MKQLSSEWEDLISKWSKAMGDFNKMSHNILAELANAGWYVNSTAIVNDIPTIKEYLDSNKIEKLNTLMINQIKADYKYLKKQLFETFAEKQKIFIIAFTAFEKQQYESSILILLTQVDSICKDLTGTRFFGRDNKQPKSKKIADEHYNEKSFLSATLHQMAACGEVNKSEADYIDGEFNRHKIIHGDDINFGNALNAYKILSLIFFMSTIVSKIRIGNK